jgi:hypothetical protein
VKKWCEIHRIIGHDLEECKTFLDRKKMPPPATPAPQEPRRDQRWVDSNGDEQIGHINMIFRGSMSITLKTQGKKIQCEISLAHRIELGRMMKWSDISISFRPEVYPDTELSERNLPFAEIVNLPLSGKLAVAQI